MIFNKLFKIDTYLFIFWITIIFIYSCTNVKPESTADSCILFEEKKRWYKDTKKSYDKWGVPISVQLAIINQESSFKSSSSPNSKAIKSIKQKKSFDFPFSSFLSSRKILIILYLFLSLH